MNIDLSEPPSALPDNGLLPSGILTPPFGEDSFDEVYDYYCNKIDKEIKNGAKYILLKHQIYLSDMRAAVLAAKAFGIPIYIVMDVDDEGETVTKCRFVPAFFILQGLGACGIGVKAPDIETSCKILKSVAHFTKSTKLLTQLGADANKDDIERLINAGASIFISGNANTVNSIIAKNNFKLPDIKQEDIAVTALDSEVFFIGDNISFTQQIECSYDIADELIAVEDEVGATAVLVTINSCDDAKLLSENAHISRLPIAVHAHSTEALEAALRYTNGRIIIDATSGLELSEIRPLAKQYGAIIY